MSRISRLLPAAAALFLICSLAGAIVNSEIKSSLVIQEKAAAAGQLSKTSPVAQACTPAPVIDAAAKGNIYVDNMDGANDTVALKARGYKPYYRGDGPQEMSTWFQGAPDYFNAFNGPTNGYVAANYHVVTYTNDIDSWLVFPEIAGGIQWGDTLYFYSRSPTGSTYPDSIRVMYSVSDSVPEGIWAELGRFKVNTTGAWELRGFEAPASSADGRFAIRYCVIDGGPDGANSDYIGIDAIYVKHPAALSQDVTVQSIDTPATVVVPPGVAFQPSFSVKNAGTSRVPAFQTSCFIYDSTGAQVWNYAAWPGDSIAPDTVMQFVAGVPFTPAGLMRYQMVVYTELSGDLRPSNDTMRLSFRTYDRNVGATAIVVPAGTYVNIDSTIAPTARFHNFATEAATFEAYFKIDYDGGPVYLENVTVAGLAPGADTIITFAEWTAPHDRGRHQMYAYTSQELDLNPANDTTSMTITTAPVWRYVANVPNGGGAYDCWVFNGSCVSNNLLWLVAGVRDFDWAILNKVGTYDPATNIWNNTRPVVNQGRVYTSAAGNDQYVFVLGGRDAYATMVYSTVERLDSPGGSAWAYVSSLPAGRVCGTAVCDNQYVYYLGGASDADGMTVTNTLWRYDIAGNTWDQTLAQIPATMSGADATLMNGKIYILGDFTNNTTYIYDIAGNTWNSVSNGSMPAASQYKAVAMYDKVWRIGGNISGTSTNDVWELDPVAGIWSDISNPMLQTRSTFSAGFINGTVVSAGGVAFPSYTMTLTAEAIDVSWMGVAGKPVERTAHHTSVLYGNHPNPFRGMTTLKYQLAKASRVNLAVYSITGQLLRTLVSGQQTAGYHSVKWNGQDKGGRAVSSGIYFCRLSANGSSATGKLVMVR